MRLCHCSAQNPTMALISLSVKSKILTMDFKTNHVLCTHSTSLVSSSITAPSLFSLYIELLPGFWTYQECFHLRDFAFAVCSVCLEWSFLRYPYGSVLSLRSVQMPLIREPSLNTFRIALFSLTLSLFSSEQLPSSEALYIYLLFSYYKKISTGDLSSMRTGTLFC